MRRAARARASAAAAAGGLAAAGARIGAPVHVPAHVAFQVVLQALAHQLVGLFLAVQAVKREAFHRKRLPVLRKLLQHAIRGLQPLLVLLRLVAFLRAGRASALRRCASARSRRGALQRACGAIRRRSPRGDAPPRCGTAPPPCSAAPAWPRAFSRQPWRPLLPRAAQTAAKPRRNDAAARGALAARRPACSPAPGAERARCAARRGDPALDEPTVCSRLRCTHAAARARAPHRAGCRAAPRRRMAAAALVAPKCLISQALAAAPTTSGFVLDGVRFTRVWLQARTRQAPRRVRARADVACPGGAGGACRCDARLRRGAARRRLRCA